MRELRLGLRPEQHHKKMRPNPNPNLQQQLQLNQLLPRRPLRLPPKILLSRRRLPPAHPLLRRQEVHPVPLPNLLQHSQFSLQALSGGARLRCQYEEL